jgi:Holliday junction resolvase RusA-like endonuclease
MRIELIIHGEPKSQQRHRHFSRGNFHGTYDPSSKDKDNFLLKAMENKPEKPLDEPLCVDIYFYFSRLKSHYGTGKNSQILKKLAPKYHTKKPDIDNLRKFVLDSLNKVYWRDDSIICQGSTCKYYTEGTPRTHIVIQSAI